MPDGGASEILVFNSRRSGATRSPFDRLLVPPWLRARARAARWRSRAFVLEIEAEGYPSLYIELQPTQKLKATLANPTIRRFLIHYFEL